MNDEERRLLVVRLQQKQLIGSSHRPGKRVSVVSSFCLFLSSLYPTACRDMGSLHRVPCIHVDKENADRVWPLLTSAIQSADFIAMDLVCACLSVCCAACVSNS